MHWKYISLFYELNSFLELPNMARSQKLEAQSRITSSFGLPTTIHKICKQGRVLTNEKDE